MTVFTTEFLYSFNDEGCWEYLGKDKYGDLMFRYANDPNNNLRIWVNPKVAEEKMAIHAMGQSL